MGLRERDTTQGSAEDIGGPGLRMLESRDLPPDAALALNCVTRDEPFAVTHLDGLEALRIVEAASRSVRTREGTPRVA